MLRMVVPPDYVTIVLQAANQISVSGVSIVAITSKAQIGDYCVVVNANWGMIAHYIYSPTGEFKLVKIY